MCLFYRGDRPSLERIAYELCEDKAKEGVVYFEARFSPHFLADKDVPLVWGQKPGEMGAREVVAAVSAGLQRGCNDFGVKARLILCAIRDKPGTGSRLRNTISIYLDWIRVFVSSSRRVIYEINQVRAVGYERSSTHFDSSFRSYNVACRDVCYTR